MPFPEVDEERRFRSAARKIIGFLRPKTPASVGIFFINNSRLRKLKQQYLRQDADWVDVLSFPAGEPFPGGKKKVRELGEVFLNRALVRRSRESGYYLLIHGILHLLGYRHDTKRARIEMEKMERRAYRKLRRRDWAGYEN